VASVAHTSARRSIWLGTLPPAAWPDSPAFRPLHFTAASANDGGALSFRSNGRKLARPDKTGRAQRWQYFKTVLGSQWKARMCMNPRAHITDRLDGAVQSGLASMLFAAKYVPARNMAMGNGQNSQPHATRTANHANKGKWVKHKYSYLRWGINE